MRWRRIVVLGDINLDIIAFHQKFPEEGYEDMAEKAYIRHGGSAANVAHTLSLLGTSAVMIGCVGEDPLGEMLVKGLVDAGVDTAHVQKTSADITGITYIVVSKNGERTMLAYRGANKHLNHTHLSFDVLNDAAILHFSGYSFLEGPQRETAFKALEKADNAVTLDLCIPLASQPLLLENIVKHVDCVFLNSAEYSVVKGYFGVSSVSDLARQWGCMVVFKKGSEGCEIAETDGEVVRLSAEPVETVDGTGAGDAFIAGFLHEMLKGSPATVCGLLATRLGALAVKTIGGRLEHL
ncbi:MAG: carbohydrate kinase family protein [Candidatus Caldarchaeum sp.]